MLAITLLFHILEIQNQRRQADLEKKSYDDLVRERDILSKVRF